jgi:glycerol-3-phosphate O-acyltransferase/dihydroxyacetone phosphate acyltransferase
VAIFPEGISHDLPGLQPLRTGAARVALRASHDGVDRVVTVAVGLIYEEKERFRSRALVRVGEPESTDRWMDGYRENDRRAVRSLTDDLAARLRRVQPDHPSWAEAEQLADVAEILARAETDLPRDVDLARRQHLVGALTRSGAESSRAVAVESLRVAHDAYRRRLAAIGLDDAEVMAGYRSGRLRWRFLWALAKVIGAAPLAAVGVAVHVVPYEVVKRMSRLPANEGMRASVKLLGCFFSFVAAYAALGVIIGESFGVPLGLMAAAGAPACGYVAVRMVERIGRMGGALESLQLARRRGPLRTSLLADRAAVVAAAGAVLGPHARVA